jgi:hypothetical protein
VSERAYQESLGVCLQSAVDDARKMLHQLGLRPYRVVLVWAKRDSKQRLTEVLREVELVPCTVTALDSVEWEVGLNGAGESGSVRLTDISPAQVGYDDLLGRAGGVSGADVEFFYELRRMPRCAGEVERVAGRYTPSSQPSLDAEGFGWTIDLSTQKKPRADASTDQPDRDESYRSTRSRRARDILRA